MMVLLLTACTPQVIGEGEVVVKDNTRELEDLQDEVDGLRRDISDLVILIEDLDLTVTSETVDLTAIEAELERITSEYDWIEDELELMRQWDESKEEYYTAVAAYLAELTDNIELPDSPQMTLYLKIDNDYYLIYLDETTRFTILFTYSDPLVGAPNVEFKFISKEVDNVLDGQFTFDQFYGETTSLYIYTVTEVITVQSILDEWLEYSMDDVSLYYDDIRTCVLAATCTVDVPTIGTE